MTEFAKVGAPQICLLASGAILMIAMPIIIAIIWTRKKKEKFTTVLVGAATPLLFAVNEDLISSALSCCYIL